MASPDTALLLAAHGSRFDREVAAVTRALAARLRATGRFAEVRAAFWREAPFWRDALAVMPAPTVLVVPHFVSRGYFTETVLPRELNASVSGGRRVIFCEPVGTHPLMVEALLRAARAAVAGAMPASTSAPVPAARETCLMIVGHGTTRHKNSAAVAREWAARIARRRVYGECRAVFLAEPPLARDWAALTVMPNVIVAPLFIAAGRHWREDLPRMLGCPASAADGPVSVSGKRLWYAKPVGGDERMVEMVMGVVNAKL
jgi:sirohydrochlorin cobaltochelatase